MRELPVEEFSMIGKNASLYRITEKLGEGVVYRAEDAIRNEQIKIDRWRV